MLGDGGRFTPEAAAKGLRRRILTASRGLIVAGALVVGGATADAVVKPMLEYGSANSPASTLVNKYEDTATELGREGNIAELPQEFDSQQVAAAYRENDADFNRRLLDMGVLLSGMVVLGAGVLKSSRRTR